jgi:uncharacterized membrane protein YvbJ
MRSPEVCPNCGADVPRNAKSCPECGSDESTGWSDETHADGLDLPEENFDYDEFVDREFGNKKAVPHGIKPFWWIIAIILLLVFTGAWVFFKYL